MPMLAGPYRTWTFDDLQQMPDFDEAGNQVDWRRLEILDGALIVSPPPPPRHGITGIRLATALQHFVPDGFELGATLRVDLGDSYLVPDLMVAPARLYFGESKLVAPADALLVVEIVSPGSRTMDRITKPAAYADAGVRAFWRVETEPSVSLTAYTLSDGADRYREVGTWGPGEAAEIAQPFAARIDIDALVPPH